MPLSNAERETNAGRGWIGGLIQSGCPAMVLSGADIRSVDCLLLRKPRFPIMTGKDISLRSAKDQSWLNRDS